MDDRFPFRPGDDAPGILAAIVEASSDAIIGKDLRGDILSWNEGAERIYGYTADEMIGRSISILIPDGHPDELPAILERIGRGERLRHYETRRRTKDGRIIEVSLAVSPIKGADGRIVGASAIAREITARKESERALRSSEARLRSVVESAVDAIIVIDARGRLESFNPAAERLFGYAAAEVTGKNVNVLMPTPYREEHDGYLSRYLETGTQKVIGVGREVTGLKKDGSTFPLHLSVGEMTVDGERCFTGILHDLTDRVRMEQLLREQAALARLGEMAAMLAHEVKNPLAAVRGAVQVIGRRLPPGGREASVIEEIVARVDGLNGLMEELLLFARPPVPRPGPVELPSLLIVTADLLMQDPAFKDIRVDVVGSALPVQADADLLKIVFLNLLINGAHAMDGRGTLKVSVTPKTAGCEVSISDSGPGIPDNVRDKMFTPFFTTKRRGTGLGLPTAKRIIEAHTGRISVHVPARRRHDRHRPAAGALIYNPPRALRLHRPLRGRDAVFRVRARSPAARGGAQSRPRRQIHGWAAAGAPGVQRSVRVGGRRAPARAPVEAPEPPGERGADR